MEVMKFIISGKNIAVTEGLKTAVEDKLGKLERYFTPETEISVTLSVEKDRQKIQGTYLIQLKTLLLLPHFPLKCYNP